jgi:hypothetical protein
MKNIRHQSSSDVGPYPKIREVSTVGNIVLSLKLVATDEP